MTGPMMWHLFGSLLALSTIAGILWWVAKRSRSCAALLGTGIVLRACLGLTLFCISYYQLPIAHGLQSGGGFWEVAPDARTYYRLAVIAADHGMETVPRHRGSPEFVVLLALWMRLVGRSPAAAFFMNILAYACISGFVVARFRPERPGHLWPCLLTIASYTFSPALLIHGSQPLKDELFVYVVGLALLAASVLLPALVEGAKRIGPRAAFIALGVLDTTMYVIAGIRAYYALTLWAVLAMVLMAGGFRQRVTRLLKYSGAAVAVLILLWIPYAMGAPAAAYSELINPQTVWTTGVARLPSLVGSRLGDVRSNFEIIPGGTNLAAAPSPTRAPSDTDEAWSKAGDAPFASQSSTVRRVVFGVAALLTPMSLMRALGLVTFNGGRGLLLIADLDTVFLDVTILAMLMLLVARFTLVKRNWTFALATVLLGGATALLLGYVVTNYGTLFRLRLIAAMPFWLLPLAATDHAFSERAIRPGPTIGAKRLRLRK